MPATIRCSARGRLKRVIQRSLQDPLATLILEGKIGDGAIVKVSAGKRGLVINGMEFAASTDDLSDRARQGVAQPRGALRRGRLGLRADNTRHPRRAHARRRARGEGSHGQPRC